MRNLCLYLRRLDNGDRNRIYLLRRAHLPDPRSYPRVTRARRRFMANHDALGLKNTPTTKPRQTQTFADKKCLATVMTDIINDARCNGG